MWAEKPRGLALNDFPDSVVPDSSKVCNYPIIAFLSCIFDLFVNQYMVGDVTSLWWTSRQNNKKRGLVNRVFHDFVPVFCWLHKGNIATWNYIFVKQTGFVESPDEISPSAILWMLAWFTRSWRDIPHYAKIEFGSIGLI